MTVQEIRRKLTSCTLHVNLTNGEKLKIESIGNSGILFCINPRTNIRRFILPASIKSIESL